MNDLRSELIYQISKNKLFGLKTEVDDFILDYDVENDLISVLSFQKPLKVNPITLFPFMEKIDVECFYNCKKLKGVVLSENLKSIEKSAFANCNQLNLDFSNCHQLEYIGEYAFSSCYNLSTLSINGELYEIDNSAFRYSYINDVYINSKLSHIGDFAFMDCNFLENIKIISNKELYIGINAFFSMMSHNYLNIYIEAPTIHFDSSAFAFSKINSMILNSNKIIFEKHILKNSKVRSHGEKEKNICINGRYLTEKEVRTLKDNKYPLTFINGQFCN